MKILEKIIHIVKEYKKYDTLFGILILLPLFYYCYSFAFSMGNNITFNPLNGDFQNYNILRRLQDGQLFGRDFNSYLGMGSMLFLYIIYLFDGSNGLSSSIFSSYLATQILFIIASVFVLRLFRISFFVSSLIAIIFYFYSIHSIYDPNSLNMLSIIKPDNSIYGLRMALPFLVGIGFYFLIPENLVFSKKQKILISLLSGIALIWSNDFSIPTYIIGSLLYILISFQTSTTKTKDILNYFIVSLLAFIAMLVLLTGGSPLEWINYNFLGVAKDQFWYFLGEVIFEPNQIPYKLYLVLEFLFAILLLFKKNKNDYILSFIILSCIVGSYLTQIGGKASDRYFISTYLLLYLLPIGAIISYLSNSMIVNLKLKIIALCLISLSLFLFIADEISTNSFYKVKDGFYFEPLLNANLDVIYKPAVDIASVLKKEAKRIPADQRMFSEYSTLMDDLIGAYQPSGNDYIIHALGDKEREKYIRSFKEHKPMYVSTIRDDFVYWEPWSKRTNWWFYRELFASNYTPKYTTHYNIVWALDQNANHIVKNENIKSYIKQVSSSETDLIFDNFLTNKDFVADVEVEYEVDFNKTIYPIIGNRFVILVDDIYYKKSKPEKRSVYQISPYLTKTNLMLQHFSTDEKNVLKLYTSPSNRTSLKIKSCKVKIIRYWNEKDEIDRIEKTQE